jgi:hypothetical protein
VGGFSCRLVEVAVAGDNVRIPHQLIGYTSWEEDGVCFNNTESGSNMRSPLDWVGIALASASTLVGTWTTFMVLFCTMVSCDNHLLTASGVRNTSLSGFGLAAAAVLVAFLGLAGTTCHGDGQTCSPASMAYVVVGGAACWVFAGLALCFEAKRGGRDDQQRRQQQRPAEWMEREFAGAPVRARSDVEMANALGGTIPVAVAVATAIAPADGVASPDLAVKPAAAKEPSPTTVLIETVANEDGTTTKTRTTTVTSVDKNGNQVIERTIERL